MSETTPADVVEELMRSCTDEVTVFHALDSADRLGTYLVAVAAGVSLDVTGPLSSWASGRPWSNDWRSRCPVRIGSMWEQLELLLLADGVVDATANLDGHQAFDVLGTLVRRANGRVR